MQRRMLKAEYLPVSLSEEQQQLSHERQKRRAVHAQALNHCWRGEGCVRDLQRDHCDSSTALENNLSGFRIALHIVKPLNWCEAGQLSVAGPLRFTASLFRMLRYLLCKALRKSKGVRSICGKFAISQHCQNLQLN